MKEPEHYHITQHMETGAPFMQPGGWQAFIDAILSASVTIDARRAARQQETDERGPQPTDSVTTGHNANA